MLVCKLFGEEYHAILADLPSVVEVLKTFDKQTYYKGGDISQVLCKFEADVARCSQEISVLWCFSSFFGVFNA